ncbi:MAG: AEC family transporter [Neisseria sp.]|nr:AEC family transporter [Neisseria sp.]MDO4228015.1 AEC family transporter [Neisseria sp.]
MFAILSITTPVFIIIGMGYFAARFSFFSREQFAGMGKFVVRIGMPMLVFSAIATRPIADVLKADYLYGYALASLLAFLAGWLASRWRG